MRRRHVKALQLAAAALAAAFVSTHAGTPAGPAGVPDAIERPASHESLLREAARDGVVIVALFSLPGCPYCEAVRRDQLRHLARGQAAQRLRVVEYELGDRRPFAGATAPPDGPADAARAGTLRTPAALAASLDIRVAPTVAFIGPDGREIAERLVGYSSPDFYGGYLEQRIAQARGRIGAR